MNMITVTAKTLDEAITKALIELGTTSDNLEYTVIEKGSSGFLGLFGKNVVIRANKKKEDDDLEAFLATGRIDSSSLGKSVKEEKKEKETPKEPVKEVQKDNSKKNSQKNQKKNQQKAPKEQAAAEKTLRSGKAPEKSAAVKETAVEEKPVDADLSVVDAEEKEEKKPGKKINVEACDKAARDFLCHVFGAMGMEVMVSVSFEEKDKEMTVDLAGPDMGILIGKRGQTLDSLQYLTSLVVNKECDGYVRVKLDTENYRDRRKATLESLARNIAYKVKRTRRNVSLEPMNPYERRIIHAALQNDRYVVTRSEGEEPFRHVVISLKREGRERDRRDRDGKRGQGRGLSQEREQASE